MIFRNISFLILSMCLLVSAQGNGPSNGQDTAGNGMSTDTMEIVGTVESVNLQDSMFVINTQEGTDTIYYNSETDFSAENADQILRLNTELRVMYITEADRNIATRIEPATANGETPQDTADTTSPYPEEPPTPPAPNEGTPPMPGE
jgi:hypothetical protein